MIISVSRARSNFPKWKIEKNRWGTKNKVKNTEKKTKNLIPKQKYIINQPRNK